MPEAFQYVSELADRIGPRPATTDAEAEAADYIQDVFTAHGLEVERQEFDSPRTYSWAYVVYHLLTIVSAGALYFADVWGPLRWAALVVAALTAIVMWMDLDTRGGLGAVLPPKGPSQNIIGKYVPKARRGERTRRIVIVAHYDSAKASLAFSPSMVKSFGMSFGLMKWCTFLVPVLILADNLSFTAAADPYLWYATLALAAYLLIPLLINVHRELFMQSTDGANDNASGVAAMLGVLDAFIPEPELGVSMPTQPIGRLKQSAGVTGDFAIIPRAAEEPAPDAGLLSYSPAKTPDDAVTQLPDDFQWAETAAKPASGQSTMDFEAVGTEVPAPGREPAAVDRVEAAPSRAGTWGEVDTDFDGDGYPDDSEPDAGRPSASAEPAREDLFGTPEQQVRPESAAPKRKGFFGLGRKKERDADVSAWLGVDQGFDARDEGRKIGSWESFDDDDDDGIGFKGGWAGDDPFSDPDFAANEASRIRKRITEHVDRTLSEKEVWFVATGAEEVGTVGMKAFIDEYASDLQGAYIINLDNLGTGTLYWVTREGMARRYSADRRLVSAARRASREEEVLAKGREYRGLSTDATPALARKLKAMSIMAFDINGRLPNWHWASDTTENVQSENIENAVKLVMGIIRDL